MKSVLCDMRTAVYDMRTGLFDVKSVLCNMGSVINSVESWIFFCITQTIINRKRSKFHVADSQEATEKPIGWLLEIPEILWWWCSQ